MFRSRAQRRKFYSLKAQGKMDQSTIDEWESDTPKNIPERVKKAMFGVLVKEALRRDAEDKRVYHPDEHALNTGLRTLVDITRPHMRIIPRGEGGEKNPISDETKARLVEEMKSRPELKGLSLQLGQHNVLESFRNMWRNKETSLPSKLTRTVLESPQTPGTALSYADHYDPFSHSVRVYTDSPAIGLHELGHASDIQGSLPRAGIRMLAGMAGPGARHLVNLHDEGQANIGASKAVKPGEEHGIGDTLFPSYGSYLGAAGGVGLMAAAARAKNSRPSLALAALLAPLAGMTAGGVAGAAYNRAKGYIDTPTALKDAGRSLGWGALGTLPPLLAMAAIKALKKSAMPNNGRINASLTDETENELNKFPDVLRTERHLDTPNLSRMSQLMLELRRKRKEETLRSATKAQEYEKRELPSLTPPPVSEFGPHAFGGGL